VRVSSSSLLINNNAREENNKDRKGERWQRWDSAYTLLSPAYH
jgi:hypothetical protein